MKIKDLIIKLERAQKQYGNLLICMDHEIDCAPAPIELIAVKQNLTATRLDKPDYLSFRADDNAFPLFESKSESRWSL